MKIIKQIMAGIDSLRVLSFWVSLFLCSVLRAENKCNVEVKLLLSPTDDQAAVTALNVKKETTGFVYFFDTNTLDLLSQGVIVRLRQGIDNDLTVKLRPSKGVEVSPSTTERETFKCEVDFIGDGANPAYSISRKFAGSPLPQSGYDISRLLSPGQRRLLEEAKASIDWSRVLRMGEIKATTWQSRPSPYFSKLALELWEWPQGRILELSTKAGSNAGPKTYAKMQDLVRSKLLALSRDQRSKTIMVLESITHDPTR